MRNSVRERAAAKNAPPAPGAIHIRAESLQALAARDRGIIQSQRPPLRDRLWWRTFTWLFILTVLTATALTGYWLYVRYQLDESTRELETTEKIIDDPPGGGSASATPAVDSAGTPLDGSPLLLGRAPDAETARGVLDVVQLRGGVPDDSTNVHYEVHAVLAGTNGWYTATVGGSSYTVAKLGAQVSLQLPSGLWYSAPLDARTEPLMFPLGSSAPLALRDLFVPSLRPYVRLHEQGTSTDIGVEVTDYAVMYDEAAIASDPATQAAFRSLREVFGDAFVGWEIGVDRDGIVRTLALTTAVDEATQTATRVRIQLITFGNTPVEFPNAVAPQPLPDDLELPFLITESH